MNSLSHLTPDELAMLLEGDMAHSDAALLAGSCRSRYSTCCSAQTG